MEQSPQRYERRPGLEGRGFLGLAISTPSIAPHRAALTVAMKALGVYDAVKPKIVLRKSVGQVYQFVDEKKADIGFVALSNLLGVSEGTRWLVPQGLYAPIRQDAVLLKKGANDEASKAYLEFLKGPEARAVIEKYGYSLE